MKTQTFTFIDFFCGAGGFTEGFRQQGFTPIRGIEKWTQAIKTHNLNFGLNDKPKDVLDFENDEEIENLEDSHILLGSPPCVSFSLANKAGKADKSLGIRLIEAYLRVVAVKKHQKNSILKAWYMENVPNSRNFVQETYTFKDLNLSNWAQKNNIDENKIALKVKENGDILNSSHYGSSQKRERFICGEFIETGEFLFPTKTHSKDDIKVLREILSNMPSPLSSTNSKISDPNYPSLILNEKDLTDHSYDTGVYEMDWKKAKRAKVNHPFGGIMSFPENLDKPSRTIMATRSAGTREALIYPSGYARKGDGEYRTPTIREVATIMGFPYLFNFTGTEGTKWRQIGNAVVPHMSFALAKALSEKLSGTSVEHNKIDFSLLLDYNKNNPDFNNLNSPIEKQFNKPPKRKMDSKFRRHILKGGNMTVDLLNYNLNDTTIPISREWNIYVYSGTGGKFSKELIPKNIYKKIEPFIQEEYKYFISEVKNLCVNIPNKEKLQELYANYDIKTDYLDLDSFYDLAENLIEKYRCDGLIEQYFIKSKQNIPTFQLLSLYLLSYYQSQIL